MKLLDLCAHLEQMQDEWQRLYDATSDEGELTTPADQAWQEYSDHVWPLVHSRSADVPPGIIDHPARLLDLHATTLEGLRAKGAAIAALQDASDYLDPRDDSIDLFVSLARDAAGPAYRPLGER